MGGWGLEVGGGCECIYAQTGWCFAVQMNRLASCGAMKSQPTQTCADNQNKHVAKVCWA